MYLKLKKKLKQKKLKYHYIFANWLSQELKHAEIFGVVEGGDIIEERLRSARETAKRPVGGFVLDGFHSAAMDQNVRAQLIRATTAELPQEKPR